MPHLRSIFFAALLAWSTGAARAGDIEGRAKPVDGDSFNIEVRIFGIDSPESGQTCKDAGGNNYPCARIASDAMAELLRGKTVLCEKQDQDTKYGRPVAICYADGVDVGAAMVRRRNSSAIDVKQSGDVSAPTALSACARMLHQGQHRLS